MNGERYYKLFGLKKGCSEQDIRKRYKTLAKKYHPDHNKSSNANEKFIEIQIAYEFLLKDLNRESSHSSNHENTSQEHRTKENEWILYRKRAFERYKAKKKKEKKELEQWCESLSKGNRKVLLFFISCTSLFVIACMIIDDFLPTRLESVLIEKYAKVRYKSMNNHPVTVVETENGNSYWLNHFNTSEFKKTPETYVEKTSIFGHPKKLIVFSGMEIQHVPIHFNFYWAQYVIYALLSIPIIAYLYNKKDVFKIMLYYFSVIGIGALLFYFFVTEDRFINLFSFIF